MAGRHPDTSISGRRVARELTDRISRRGKPDIINSDHGTEFTLNAILAWSKDHCMEWHYIAPGKLIQNGYVESFNGRMAMSLRIPMKPAMHSDAMPATHSDFMPAGIPI